MRLPHRKIMVIQVLGELDNSMVEDKSLQMRQETSRAFVLFESMPRIRNQTDPSQSVNQPLPESTWLNHGLLMTEFLNGSGLD